MMSGLVGFISFPQGFKCSIFAPITEKITKSRSSLGAVDQTYDEGKITEYFVFNNYSYNPLISTYIEFKLIHDSLYRFILCDIRPYIDK